MEKQEIGCETVSYRNVTNEASPAWLPKHCLDKEDTNRHTNMEGDKFRWFQPKTKNYSYKEMLSCRNSLPWGKTHQLICQVASPENIYTNNIQTIQVVLFMYFGIQPDVSICYLEVWREQRDSGNTAIVISKTK